MALTLEQKIARKEQEVAKLKEQARKLETGQKIVLGGVILAEAKKNPQVAKQLLGYINENVTRKADIDRLENVVEELKKKANEINEINHQPNFNQQ
jgi:hypothetical protein